MRNLVTILAKVWIKQFNNSHLFLVVPPITMFMELSQKLNYVKVVQKSYLKIELVTEL